MLGMLEGVLNRNDQKINNLNYSFGINDEYSSRKNFKF